MFRSFGNTIFDDETGDVFEVEEREEQEVEYDPTDKLDFDDDTEIAKCEHLYDLAKEEAVLEQLEQLEKEQATKNGKGS